MAQNHYAKRGPYKVAGFVTGTTARAVVDRAIQSGQLELGKDEKLCLFTTQSHKAGVKLLCDGALHFYFGDIDLIEAYRSEHVGECEVDRAEAPLSYEPYALLVPSQDPKFRAKFVAAVYEIFADGTAAGRFAIISRGCRGRRR